MLLYVMCFIHCFITRCCFRVKRSVSPIDTELDKNVAPKKKAFLKDGASSLTVVKSEEATENESQKSVRNREVIFYPYGCRCSPQGVEHQHRQRHVYLIFGTYRLWAVWYRRLTAHNQYLSKVKSLGRRRFYLLHSSKTIGSLRFMSLYLYFLFTKQVLLLLVVFCVSLRKEKENYIASTAGLRISTT